MRCRQFRRHQGCRQEYETGPQSQGKIMPKKNGRADTAGEYMYVHMYSTYGVQ